MTSPVARIVNHPHRSSRPVAAPSLQPMNPPRPRVPRIAPPLTRFARTPVSAVATGTLAVVLLLHQATASTPDFARDIRPLLEAHCLECHGAQKQKADLRLDHRASAFAGGESGPVILPGNSQASLLVRRVSHPDPDHVMPPGGKRLDETQIQLLRDWIDQGAPWDAGGDAPRPPAHWAFQPLARPNIPTPHGGLPSPSSPIDAFIVDGLAQRQLSLSPEAPRSVLIRRLYLVMLGLPPTPAEVDAFTSDPDPNAFERLVDRILADSRYGERWARHWLDVIRFAESNGFETNRERPNAWRFRDYVIGAFNHDLPFNRFVLEQLAGDALGADVATGFLVGGPVDIVGSPDPALTAQQRADELDDMVNTTGTAFLGLTLGCARCHNHKFDPVEQREYYAFSAMFAGVRHGERPLPPDPAQAAEITRLDGELARLEKNLAPYLPVARPLPPDAAPPAEPAGDGSPGLLRPPVHPRFNVDRFPPIEARFLRFTILASSGGEPCLDELEAYDGTNNLALASLGTRATASGTLPGYEIHQLAHLNDGRTGNRHSWISRDTGTGWVQLEFPHPVRLDHVVWGRDRQGEYGDRLPIRYHLEAALEPGAWRTLASSADRQPFTAPPPAQPPTYRFTGLPAATAAQGRALLADLETTRSRRDELSRKAMAYAGTFVTPGPTHRLHRGDPLQKREAVPPATLALHRPVALPTDAPEQERRLALARWIADDLNPLTPRVIVNRLWQHHFGVGLVDTPNDFGHSGSPPTHPALLDWLASELLARGWSLKALHREILLSATWRQSSTPRPEALRVDATSRLLWRFPPRRLEAEAIRDAMLAVSGNLDPHPGGPSFHLHEVDRENVYHYHPKDDFGPSDFRRMVYAYKVRMEQDGIFGAFDCPDGSLIVARRSRSTTALQALNLFNSPFALQQASALAERLRREAGDDPAAQIQRGWELAFNRRPTPAESTQTLAFAARHGLPAVARALLNANEFLFIP